MLDLLTDLNPKQREAVAAPENHTLVLAGAGSGKTRVLVHRIAWLIQHQHVSPHAVFAVTFTNKAANEMRSRIESLLNISVQGLWVGTFHRLAHRILRIHWQAADLPEQFQILDSDDQLRLVKRVIRDSGLSDKEFEPKRLQWFINDKKDAGLRPDHIDDVGDRDTKTLVRLYASYQDACERSGVVDFAELLLRAYELIKNNDAIRQQYQQRFSHILVDEFQDTNTIQYAWLRLIAGSTANVMAVGDDDQSIYGWRGAKVENILQFSKDFPTTLTVRLEQNYRSTSTILSAANALIAQNSERLGKDLWTEGEQGQPITVYAAFNDLEEARYIVTVIQSQRLSQCYRDIAILYRSNAQSRVLEEALIHAGIPYRVYGGLRFFDRAEIKDALAYLRILSNQNDDAAMERVINNPPRGIGEKSLQNLRLKARQENTSLWQAVLTSLEEQAFAPRAHNALASFVQLMTQIVDECRDIALYEKVEVVINRSGLWQHLNKGGMQAQSRLENLQELVSACKEYSHSYFSEQEEANELSAFLSHAALEAGEQQADTQSDYVQLMTLHSAKGLEFPTVIIAGLEEGLFPHMMSISDAQRLEEERRLCYVGMTRAMQKLILTFAESRRIRGSDERHRPSRFIRELPPQYLHHEKLTSSRPQPYMPPKQRSAQVDSAIPASQFSIGQLVSHAVFGDGIILNYEGQGANARVQIQFNSGEIKWLMLSYAKLTSQDSQPSG